MNPDTAAATCTPQQVSLTVKTQWVRLLDVLLIGPLMVAGGMSLTRNSPFWGVALGGMGFATIVYNGLNYYTTRQAAAALPPVIDAEVASRPPAG